MVEASGLAFIGPSSGPMHAMGDKLSSKKIAKEAGCFVIPGFEGEIENEEHAVQLARFVSLSLFVSILCGKFSFLHCLN